MSKCEHDPKLTEGPIGMYHCPECGDMVIAGMDHPDMDKCEEEYNKYCDAKFEELLHWLMKKLGREDGIPFIAMIENNEKIKNVMMEIWLHVNFNPDFNCMRCNKETFAHRLYCSPFCEKAQELELTE